MYNVPVKLLCLNVCQFEKNNERLKDFLEHNKVDIACFQEITRSTEGKSDPELVSYETINTYSGLDEGFFAPIWVLNRFYMNKFHGQESFDFSHGGDVEFGNLLRTRYRIVKGQNIFLQNHFTYVTNWDNWPEEDYRGVQVVDLDLEGGKKLRVLNYHGIWSKNKLGNEKTLKACQQIKETALAVSYPSIICGDFNLFPDTDSIKLFNGDFENLLNTYNINTTRPKTNELSSEKRNVVDYIFVSKGIKATKLEVLQSGVSDHLPLTLDFEI